MKEAETPVPHIVLHFTLCLFSAFQISDHFPIITGSQGIKRTSIVSFYELINYQHENIKNKNKNDKLQSCFAEKEN